MIFLYYSLLHVYFMYIWQMMMKMIRKGGSKRFGTNGQIIESGNGWVSH